MKNRTLLLIGILISISSIVKSEVIYNTQLGGRDLPLGILLEWSTLTEINSGVFVVEKSLDGINFESITTIDAMGDSDTDIPYMFLDRSVTKKRYFYRLKEIDLDDVSSYSQTISIDMKSENSLNFIAFSPFELKHDYFANIDSKKEGTLFYKLLNVSGEVIVEDKKDLINGINQIKIEMKNYPAGKYRIVYEFNEEKESFIFNKLPGEFNIKTNVASKE